MDELLEKMARGMHAVSLAAEEDELKPAGWDDEALDHRKEWLSYARAALSAISAAGWAVVPKEPDEAMVKALSATVGAGRDPAPAMASWYARLRAAPKVPLP